MKFMFSTVYRVTQKDFYARPYTSMWAPVVARQISKRYSSSSQVFISMWGVISSTASMSKSLNIVYSTAGTVSGKHPKQHVTEETVDRVRESFSRSPCKSIMLINTWQELWLSFRYLSSYNRYPHWSVRTCITIFLSYSVRRWKQIS